jgi:transcriptional regulator with XRE-family HTH domain
MEVFGMVIKALRIKNGLLLREVAAAVEVDTSLISKFEKGDRFPTKAQVYKLALLFKESSQALYITCLSSKIVNEIKDEKIIKDVLEGALSLITREEKSD